MGKRSILLALCLLLLVTSGCITRPSKQKILSEGMTEVYLRSDVRWTSTVAKDYSHPVAISQVRLSHILSRIDVRPPEGWLPTVGKEKRRVPIIATELLESISGAMARALAEANSDQEVVVMAVKETKRWGVFDHDYLTSFVAYVRGDQLYLHFNHFDWEIPKRRDDNLPVPRIGRHPGKFRLYPGDALTRVDESSVAVEWRNPIFAKATRIQVLPSGEIERREILEETPPEELDVPAPAPSLPEGLSPDQLRGLADLEEARRGGRITEAEYRTKRRELLGEE